MNTQLQEKTINISDLLNILEPLIRRVVREELVIVKQKSDVFYLESDSPLYEDMEEILERKAKDEIKLFSHEEVSSS